MTIFSEPRFGLASELQRGDWLRIGWDGYLTVIDVTVGEEKVHVKGFAEHRKGVLEPAIHTFDPDQQVEYLREVR